MTPEAQRIAIAEARGFSVAYNEEKALYELLLYAPDYFNDLNAMHEAEKVLTEEQQYKYVELLVGLAWDEPWGFTDAAKVIHATAAQRAEAFLRAIGKWKDK